MKTIKNITTKMVFSAAILLLTMLSCERDLSNDVVPATFNNSAEIFTDAPVGLTDQFFVSFDPATGANVDGFGVDDNVAYKGKSSIRIDVPAETDPAGGYIGGIFRDRGEGRNLTGYNALTFWAKGSTTATIGEAGFGTAFGDDFPIGVVEDKYAVAIRNIQLSTDWRKYTIPIPDPSKLVQEKGMFLFAAGSASTAGMGYTFWIDELKFENLSNIGQSRPTMLGGSTADFISVPGQTLNISGFTGTYNLSNGQDVTVITTPNYFSFSSSNPSVASVSEEGLVTVKTTGTAEITATLDGVLVKGAVNVQSFPDARIISIFSDFYANVPVDGYNGFYEPFQTTLGGATIEDGNNIIDYTLLNFVGIEFYGRYGGPGVAPIDATQMTHFNIDFRVNEALSPSDFIRIELINNVNNGQTGHSFTVPASSLASNQWVSLKIPLSSFPGLQRNALGIILFDTGGNIKNLSVDNIFFSKE
ncbi:Ig-like domain-containing protein [Gaetbulibacter aquiaggeris]|uniref:Ig-like domain-containing protein n=1 Tax=Gaetbulibacter aquiaggeris TaxID=1735373 RepID=A0ABW7MKT7_9FLAO